MTTAVVLIGADRDAMSSLGGALADLEGVAEAYSVTGEWDFVAIVRVPRHEMLAEVVTGELVKLPGVARTQTMVAFEVFSRHDLEAGSARPSRPSSGFSVGQPASRAVGSRAMSDQPAHKRTDRIDFRATSDPALQEAADRGEANLLTYRELYELWERQQWAVQDIDFTQDRIDWHERIDAEERVARMYGLSSFFVGEQRVAAELGPIMRAVPDEDMRIFLCTQIADEARHVAFFDRFYDQVGVLEADGLQARLEETSDHLNPEFDVLFDELLRARVDRLAVEPEDREALVEAITIYHMIVEGMLALTGQHFIIDYNEQAGTLPGFVQGFTNVARDEHRHVAFGARFLRDMAREDPRYGAAIQRTLGEVGPVAEGVLRPKWVPEDVGDDVVIFGASVDETRAFALQALERRLKVIGLAAAA
jgi:ribonucleoside-diphosphate reductase beta chain